MESASTNLRICRVAQKRILGAPGHGIRSPGIFPAMYKTKNEKGAAVSASGKRVLSVDAAAAVPT